MSKYQVKWKDRRWILIFEALIDKSWLLYLALSQSGDLLMTGLLVQSAFLVYIALSRFLLSWQREDFPPLMKRNYRCLFMNFCHEMSSMTGNISVNQEQLLYWRLDPMLTKMLVVGKHMSWDNSWINAVSETCAINSICKNKDEPYCSRLWK